MTQEQLTARLEELEAAYKTEQERLATFQKAVEETQARMRQMEGMILENRRWLEQEAGK